VYTAQIEVLGLQVLESLCNISEAANEDDCAKVTPKRQ